MEQIKETVLYIPFRIDIDPMDKLLLMNFEKDPDSVYVGFEPQVFIDKNNNEAHLVIGWRVDGKVDVYHQPGLSPDPEKYNIAGKGLHQIAMREMSEAFFEIDDYGVQAFYSFHDLYGRDVILRVKERNTKKRKPFGLLAPMGFAAEKPSSLPLIYLHDFYFVRKKHTVIEISIQGKHHKPDKLPLPMDWTQMYFTRYSPRPLIATFNPAFNGVLEGITVEEGIKEVQFEDYTMNLQWDNKKPCISDITRNNNLHPIQVAFSPPFPAIHSHLQDVDCSGSFIIEGDPSTGKIPGRYSIVKQDEKIIISLTPSGGWKPRPTKLSLRFMYRAVKIFRNWPSTYEWNAKIHIDKQDVLWMESAWKRNI